MNSKAIGESLKRWFNSTGFPLEIEAARSFKHASFSVEQSSAYVDPETEKGREIDLLAYRRDATGCFNAFFAVECKSSDKPWVVLTSRDQHTRYGGLHIALLSQGARHALGDNIIDYVRIYAEIFGPSCGGYALKQAFSGQSDLAYAASVGSLKAASWISSEEELGLVFGFPVIVVNTTIYEYSESLSGEQNFTEVPDSSFEFRAYWKQNKRAFVRIVSSAHLDSFTQKCKLLVEQYQQLFSRDIYRAFRGNIK
ncbi:hypothetical protein [Xanthomonas sp. CFBP 8445]|uniref:hypothetical protein n=1 Tax=Xanthomonas sp. CFBP 8445 TaxID=2971236 RepID=UPI0021E0373A|nr:hypothetical protein [Xanthomonas sp. CFBP 8445]UYC14027.1 hypothetical protein NUG21_09990 [Xanthomonas sp. CFBP 8445]